jgi:hypothetical protein
MDENREAIIYFLTRKTYSVNNSVRAERTYVQIEMKIVCDFCCHENQWQLLLRFDFREALNLSWQKT